MKCAGEIAGKGAPAEAAAAAGEARFLPGRRTPSGARAVPRRRAAEPLAAEKAALGRRRVEERGKTLRSAVAEVEKCARVCRHYAADAPRVLGDEPIATEAA